MLFGVDTIELEIESSAPEEVLKTVGSLLFSNGYVHDSFIRAILEREEIHPTGLPTKGFGIAIPHTDPEHVVQTRVAVATVKETVSFSMMGNPDVKIPVKIIFMLAVKDPKQQPELLKKLMALFQNEELLQEIGNTQDKQKVNDLLTYYFSLKQ